MSKIALNPGRPSMNKCTPPDLCHTDLRALIHQTASVQAGMRIADLYRVLAEGDQEYVAVLDGERAIGLCSGREIGMLLGSEFGRALNLRHPVEQHMLEDFDGFLLGQALSEVLQVVSLRPQGRFYDDVVLADEEGRFIGLIAVRDLIQLQHRLLLANIQAIRTHRDEIDRRNREVEQDLQMARDLQLAILPDRYPEILLRRGDRTHSLHFHHRYESADRVGGDFLQIVRVSESCAGVLLCDVMGHGVRSALVTAMLRALMEGLRPVAHDPGETLTRINRELTQILQRLDSPMFATALYVVFDLAAGVLRIAKAGHPDPLRCKVAQGGCEWLRCTGDAAGPALGFFPDALYGAVETPLEAGDRLLLFTDGLIEVFGRDGEELGEEGLLVMAREQALPDLTGSCEALLQGIRAFSSTGLFDDDACLVGIELRVTGNGPSAPNGGKP